MDIVAEVNEFGLVSVGVETMTFLDGEIERQVVDVWVVGFECHEPADGLL